MSSQHFKSYHSIVLTRFSRTFFCETGKFKQSFIQRTKHHKSVPWKRQLDDYEVISDGVQAKYLIFCTQAEIHWQRRNFVSSKAKCFLNQHSDELLCKSFSNYIVAPELLQVHWFQINTIKSLHSVRLPYSCEENGNLIPVYCFAYAANSLVINLANRYDVLLNVSVTESMHVL